MLIYSPEMADAREAKLRTAAENFMVVMIEFIMWELRCSLI